MATGVAHFFGFIIDFEVSVNISFIVVDDVQAVDLAHFRGRQIFRATGSPLMVVQVRELVPGLERVGVRSTGGW